MGAVIFAEGFANMANDFFTANQVAQVALRLAEEDQALSALVARNIVNPIAGGGQGTAVQLKVPNALVAYDRDIDSKSAELVYGEIAESVITVTANKAAYSGVSLSDGDMSLHLADFASQVLVKQVDAVVDRVEKEVADTLNAIPTTDDIAWDEASPLSTFTAIRKELRQRGVPAEGIQCVVGVDVYAALLEANVLTDASQSASTAALREAQVGRVRGFNVVESTRVADGDIIAFHRDAFTLAVRPPAPAQGQFAATVSGGGFGLRYTRGFDMTVAKHLSLVDTMFALVKLPMYKVERNYTTHAATATQLAAGEDATLRVSTGSGS